MGDLYPASKETREGQGALLVRAAWQVTLIGSNQYALWDILG